MFPHHLVTFLLLTRSCAPRFSGWWTPCSRSMQRLACLKLPLEGGYGGNTAVAWLRVCSCTNIQKLEEATQITMV